MILYLLITYKKAVVSLNAAPLSIQTRCICTKKAGLHCCCSAFRGSRIAFCSEQATPKPTPICTHAHTPIYGVYRYGYTYPEDIKMLQCVGTVLNLRDSEMPSTKRVMTPYYYVQKATTGVFGQIYYRILVIFFGFPRGDTSHPLNPALDFRLQNYNISLNNARKIIKKSKQPYQFLFISSISNDRFGLKNPPANY